MASPGSAASTDYKKLSEIDACYQNSMTLLSNALAEDETGSVNLAVKLHVKALKSLREGVRIDITGPEYSGAEWSIARGQQKEMMEGRLKAKQKLYELKGILGATSVAPAYAASPPEDESFNFDGTTELLTISGGVRIFFVSEDQHVGTTPPSYPTFLRVLVDNDTEQVFLQVFDWTYPLNKALTPTLKTNSGVYIFPNHVAVDTAPQGYIGIVILDEVDRGLVETFEIILQNFTHLSFQRQEDQVDFLSSNDIVGAIERGTEWLSCGLSQGAEYTSDLVQNGAEKLKENLTPNEHPTTVRPDVQKILSYTHHASEAAVKASLFLEDGLSAIGSRVGQVAAPHAKEFSERILPGAALAKGNEGDSIVDGVVKTACAGQAGFGRVWAEMERAAETIVGAVSAATVETVEYKYGQEAGVAASKAIGSIVNVGKTAFILDNFGFKAIARRVATDAGGEVLMGYSTSTTQQRQSNGTSVDMMTQSSE